MDPITNPFSPGAGTQPPELAGRDKILDDARIILGRTKLGRSTKSLMLLGLRGVGKTVLLNRIDDLAVQEQCLTLALEAPEDRPLAEMLVPKLRSLLVNLSRLELAKDAAKRALGALRAFAGALKINVGDVEFTVQPTVGTADSGNLESDLPELLLAVATAAKVAVRPVVLFIDEVQYLTRADLSALVASVHKVSQKALPLVVFGAGLPQLAALTGDAKSYAERLFAYPNVGALAEDAARDAIEAPLNRQGVQIAADALGMIVERTKGYPYFLQEWGSQTWNVAGASPIVLSDVERATVDALSHLDEGFFRVRLDRLTPREKDYMCAMAQLGAGPHRSGEIAQCLGMDVTTAGPLRNNLIKKGMIFSPQHGDTAFTVPMFDEFLKRSMPNWKPSAPLTSESRRPKPPKRKRKSR